MLQLLLEGATLTRRSIPEKKYVSKVIWRNYLSK